MTGGIAPTVAWHLDATLGEGPIWLAGEQALRFVDIKRGRVHRFDPATGRGETAETGGSPSFVMPSDDGGLLVGSRQAIHRLDGDRLGAVVVAIPELARNRINDATVDAHGRLWFGTMDDREESPTGAIWCLDRGELHRAGPEATITNGPAASADWLYHVDTLERVVWRSRLGTSPTIEQGEVFVRLGKDEGYPDGIVVDAEDCLWLAVWGGWGVRRYSPAGELLLEVRFPCAQVTKIAFGGPDLRTVYATTARKGLSDSELAEQPLAGSLFSFAAPAPGREVPPVRLAGPPSESQS